MTFIEEYLEAGEKNLINIPRRVKKQYELLLPIIEGKDPRWYYNPKKAEKPIEFAERFCRQSKDAWIGKPMRFMLWQKAGISAIYGFLERDSDLRKHRRVFELCGKKNGKTTKMAPIALYETAKRGNEVYCAANARDQAKIVWDEANNMLEQSPQLQSILRKRQYEIVNTRKDGFSKFVALANKPNLLDGKLPKFVILDEVHELSQALYDILHNGQISVKDPLLWMLTTKGYVRNGLFDEEYKNSCDILDGIVEDERKFSLLYELDSPENWLDEDIWQQANPSLGTILTYEDLREAVKEGLSKPNSLNAVKTKHFNIGGKTLGGFFDFDAINNEKTFDMRQLKKYVAFGGLDLSRTNDLTSFSTFVWDKKMNEFLCETMYWMSQDYFERCIEDPRMGNTWRIWVDKGFVQVAGKNIIDHSAITRYILKMAQKYGICYRWIYYDPYTAPFLVQDLHNNGFAEGDCLTKCFQGAKTLAVPFQLLDAELRAGRVNYNNNPVTKWCLTNVGVETDRNGNDLPIKAGKNNDRKIDGFMTMLDAFVGFCDHRAEIGA